MDLQTRKLEFIQEFLKLQNADAISRLEKLLKVEKVWDRDDLKAMSPEEFKGRIDRSIADSENGRLTELSKLLSEIEGWK
ncbi:MAG TPA: hypothetical protein VJ949_07505 [Cryomorphaceae bacterium]|nr:hypothetical protein [Cryomorphaceae bacterium]HKL39740.1 hypothetical protein [Cryomorphaceae bacterium]